MKHELRSAELFVLTLCLSAIITSSTKAQIPNPGFENWSYDQYQSIFNPDGWNTNNDGFFFTTIQRTTESHSDSFAVYGATTWYRSFLVSPILGTGFPINKRPAEFTGYYQFHPVKGDTLFVDIDFYDKSKVVAVNSFPISQEISSYTQFHVIISYLTSDTPDSCNINITISNKASQEGSANPGTYFLLDDLAFSDVNDVPVKQQTASRSYLLQQNYPNPFNPTTNIEFQIAKTSFVTLKVFDLLGRDIATLVNEQLTPGTYQRIFNGRDLPSGIYFYRLRSGAFVSVKKLILQK